ncbi:hypothetical protein N5J77_01975 [Sphingobium yanoikuyae]|uniref:Uncharacterized protein n=1 Tax=Sphingobium yanoikuyae TaxID=13690 RepID=A0AA42WT41_SPHYA|nr:hypothetical protein [Sphingobium yanoikuyae]MDH2129876.1 hypothetical protein [Sphingobium yanoikuyae]MDH2147870.1 hypothetical protein [Sphingobium yanoikuyae]MDH2165139.1 hypothetical protein [Sphingobium yanoikuyae]
MSDACETLVRVMLDHEAPEAGWTMPHLRKMADLSVGNFAAAIQQLRAQGKMHPFNLALSPSMWPAAPKVEAPTLAEQVAAEAKETGARRHVAASTGRAHGIEMPSPGALLQERALTDAPALAASIMKDRWGPLWDRVCRHARETNQRPIPAMIALLDRGLNAGEAA